MAILSTGSVNVFVVVGISDNRKDLDIRRIVNGKVSGHYMVQPRTVWKAGPSFEIVKRPKRESWERVKTYTLRELVALLLKNPTGLAHRWEEAFNLAEKTGKEIVVRLARDKHLQAITGVWPMSLRIGVEDRDETKAPNSQWGGGIDISSLKDLQSITIERKGWFKGLTWKTDTLGKLIDRTGGLNYPDHFLYNMKRVNDKRFFGFGFTKGDWQLSIQAGKGYAGSYPRINGLVVDEYDNWEVQVGRKGRNLMQFDVRLGAGMDLTNGELGMPYRSSFDRNYADLNTEEVDFVFQWMRRRFGSPNQFLRRID